MKINNYFLNQALQYGLNQGSVLINKNNGIGIRVSEKVEISEPFQTEKYADNTNYPDEVESTLTLWGEAESLLAAVSEDIAEEPDFSRNSIHKPIDKHRVMALLGLN